MENQLAIYETANVDLAAFLMLQGIKFIECVSDTRIKVTKPVVKMRFLDERAVCLDLERVFMSSDFKKYRDLNKYLLKEIHNKIREIS